jgi:hypothetical protein
MAASAVTAVFMGLTARCITVTLVMIRHAVAGVTDVLLIWRPVTKGIDSEE